MSNIFDGGFGPSNFRHLKKIYQLEEISEDDKINYQQNLKKMDPKSYEEFLNFKERMESTISNFKEVLLHGDDPIMTIK